MFRSSPLDAFKKKLQCFVDDFHSEKLNPQQLQLFKNTYRALPDKDKRSIHLEVKARTMNEACNLPNLTSYGMVITACLSGLTALAAHLNPHENNPTPSEHLIDTPLEVLVVSLALLTGIAFYNKDNYWNRYNKPAHLEALKLFDEVAEEEKKETELDAECPSPYELDL